MTINNYPDIRPTLFRLYRSDWLGNQIKIWQGCCCYLTDALEAYCSTGGSLNSISLASFDQLDLPYPKVFSDRELRDAITWMQNR